MIPCRRTLATFFVSVVFLAIVFHGNLVFAALTASSDSVNVTVGASHAFSISGGTGFYKVTSSASGVATASISGNFSEKGTIIGIATGTAVVTIEDSAGDSVTIDVQVSEITVDQTNIFVAVQNSETVKVLTGSGFYNVSTSNDTIADATISGDVITITGVAIGNATITVSDSNANSVNVAVTVGATPSPSISATTDLGMSLGEIKTFSLAGVGSGFYKTKNTDNTIAQIEILGEEVTITALAPGTTQMIIEDTAGSMLTIDVQVSAFIADKTDLELGVGESQTVSLSGGSGFYQVSVGDKAVTSHTVQGNDVVLTGLSTGNTQVTIEDNDGSTVIIDVVVSEIILSKKSVFLMVQKTDTIDILSSSNFFNVASSNPQVASVGLAGKVITITGVSQGTATITVENSVGQQSDIQVTVQSAVTTQVNLAVGDTQVETLAGGSGFFKKTVDDPAIAAVTLDVDNITFLALVPGKTTVTIEDSQGKQFLYEVVVALPAPVLNKTINGTQVELSWDPVTNAGVYFLYYAPADPNGDPDQTKIGTATLVASQLFTGAGEQFTINLISGSHYFTALQAIHVDHADVVSPLSNIVELVIP